MMKNILMLCFGLLFLAACEKNQDSTPYEIVVEQQKYTLDDQGKATISCKVSPEEFDISNMQMLYSPDVWSATDDIDWAGVDIISVTKDTKTPGKWDVVIGLTRKGGKKPYTPNPKYSYEMKAVVNFFTLKTDGEPVHSAKFQFSLDISRKDI
ncbi:MAG: hypothetical protein RRY55_05520 [Bacteroidales bacterium]